MVKYLYVSYSSRYNIETYQFNRYLYPKDDKSIEKIIKLFVRVYVNDNIAIIACFSPKKHINIMVKYLYVSYSSRYNIETYQFNRYLYP
jgi:hypothetical protein